MKRGASLYLFIGLLIVGIFLAAYYLNLGITGFAIYQEDFTNGQHNGTVYNGSALILNSTANATSGDYTSKIYDGGSSARWDNLTYTGSQALTFQVRSCTSNCTNETFASANLSNLNLTGQYFQYRVFFPNTSNLSLQSVSIGSSTINVAPTVNVVQPSGTKTASSGLALDFVVTGTGLTCWYNVVDNSDSALIIDNTSISNCANTTFDLGAGEGDYRITVYANSSAGLGSGTSLFTINIVTSTTTEEESTTETESTVQVPVTASQPAITEVTELTADDVSALKVVPGSVHEIKWTVRDSGTTGVSSCSATVQGDVASWATVAGDTVNLNSGDSNEFSITISVPEDAVDAAHSLTLSASCTQTQASVSKPLSLTVEKKKLGFEVIDAQRTRGDRVRVVYSLKELTGQDQEVAVKFAILDVSNQEVANSSQNRSLSANETNEFSVNVPINESLEGNFSISATANSEVYTTTVLEPITLGAPVGGFAVFGEGLGTGGFILIIVVLVIVVALIVGARMMRKSGKTLKGLFHLGDSNTASQPRKK